MKRAIRVLLQLIAVMLVVSAPSCSRPDHLLPMLAERIGMGLLDQEEDVVDIVADSATGTVKG